MKKKSFSLLLISSMALLVFSCRKSIDPVMQEGSNAGLSQKQYASLESNFSRAFDINNSGAIAGSFRNADGKTLAFVLKNNDLWYSAEEVRPNGLPEIKFCINDPGDIAGSKINGTGIIPMLWRNGQAYE